MKYHRKPKTVEAWQFLASRPVPAWVARHVHQIGDEYPDNRTCRDWQGVLHTVEPGDFIVKHPGVDGVYAPIPEQLFLKDYEVAL